MSLSRRSRLIALGTFWVSAVAIQGFGAYLPPQPAVDLASLGHPELFESADFNGDQRQDLILALSRFQTADTFPIRILTSTPGAGSSTALRRCSLDRHPACSTPGNW